MRVKRAWAGAAALTLLGLAASPRSQDAPGEPARGNLPPSPVPAPALAGTPSCAGRSCHGSAEPRSGSAVEQDEFTRWLAHDPHQEAYRTLQGEASRAIARHLGLPGGDAHTAPLCLSCHTNPAAAETPADPRRATAVLRERAYGVGCESCHGNASGWLDAHLSEGWRLQSSAEKQARHGMTAVRDAAAAARACAGCHVGAPPGADGAPGRDVNHDLIAAGHPRLAFEFSAFLANLPRHWKPRTEPAAEARRWAVGQAVAAESALDLLRHRAESAAAPWPEFAEYDCYACHHALAEPSRRQGTERAGGRRPGTLPWGTWYYAMPRVLARADPVDRLARLMERPAPPRGEVAAEAGKARREMHELTASLQGKALSAAALLPALAADRRLEGASSWDACEQLFLGLEALNAEARQAAYRRRLDAVLELRARPAGFDPAAFYKALRGASGP